MIELLHTNYEHAWVVHFHLLMHTSSCRKRIIQIFVLSTFTDRIVAYHDINGCQRIRVRIGVYNHANPLFIQVVQHEPSYSYLSIVNFSDLETYIYKIIRSQPTSKEFLMNPYKYIIYLLYNIFAKKIKINKQCIFVIN